MAVPDKLLNGYLYIVCVCHSQWSNTVAKCKEEKEEAWIWPELGNSRCRPQGLMHWLFNVFHCCDIGSVDVLISRVSKQNNNMIMCVTQETARLIGWWDETVGAMVVCHWSADRQRGSHVCMIICDLLHENSTTWKITLVLESSGS